MSRSKLPFELTIQLITLLAGLPALVLGLTLLWTQSWTTQAQSILTIICVGIWVSCIIVVRSQVVFPMRTLSNLLAAIREGDYSLRARKAAHRDSLGEVLREVNELGQTLHDGRQRAAEASALLLAVMAEIDVALFAFDDSQHLRLVNRAGTELLGHEEKLIIGQTAAKLSVQDWLSGHSEKLLTTSFPGKRGTRWSLRRTGFREGGRPHQLIVLADVSQPLREEERAAWQRIIRVLGHEMNNSLAPIQSIAGSLSSIVRKDPRPEHWESDIDSGLEIIANRAESLSRFMGAYARLARLPDPNPRLEEIGALIRRVVAVEMRVQTHIETKTEVFLPIDSDQIEQVLINLLRNAADAALEAPVPEIRIEWQITHGQLELFIDDNGPGLSNTSNLFVPFFTTKKMGSGIGLVLCRQITEAHHGMLTLENRNDVKQGCRATIRLPLDR
jgi:two-component system, NtrC family, nitrogen regulation sensor histidine kinase NtrY